MDFRVNCKENSVKGNFSNENERGLSHKKWKFLLLVKTVGGNRGVVLWRHFVRGLSGYFKEDSVKRSFWNENERGSSYKNMEFFVTSKNGVGKSGGDFMSTFCSWTFDLI